MITAEDAIKNIQEMMESKGQKVTIDKTRNEFPSSTENTKVTLEEFLSLHGGSNQKSLGNEYNTASNLFVRKYVEMAQAFLINFAERILDSDYYVKHNPKFKARYTQREIKVHKLERLLVNWPLPFEMIWKLLNSNSATYQSPNNGLMKSSESKYRVRVGKYTKLLTDTRKNRGKVPEEDIRNNLKHPCGTTRLMLTYLRTT